MHLAGEHPLKSSFHLLVATFANPQEKIKGTEYETIQEVWDDVKLVWSNCRAYNTDSHPFIYWAETVEQEFEKRIKIIIDRYSPEGI